jgi:hypothetical protein
LSSSSSSARQIVAGLRAHPNNPLHSRIETLQGVFSVGSTPNLNLTTIELRVVAELTVFLSEFIHKHEQHEAAPSPNADVVKNTFLLINRLNSVNMQLSRQAAALLAAGVATLLELSELLSH